MRGKREGEEDSERLREILFRSWSSLDIVHYITAASIATLEINKILTLSPSARTFRAIGIFIPQNLGAMMDFIK